MNIKIIKTFQASICLGLETGYTGKLYNKELIIEELQVYQKNKIQHDKIYLSASVSECNIVLSGQNEKHLKLDFINYPKFEMTKKNFKKEVIDLAKHLLIKMQQNRTVVVFTDETIMIEVEKNIDPKI